MPPGPAVAATPTQVEAPKGAPQVGVTLVRLKDGAEGPEKAEGEGKAPGAIKPPTVVVEAFERTTVSAEAEAESAIAASRARNGFMIGVLSVGWSFGLRRGWWDYTPYGVWKY
jgi:hypothetical protein